jgi:hypothetical protein
MRARHLVVVLSMVLAVSGGSRSVGAGDAAAELGAADRQAIQAVVGDQLAAFQRDDGVAAFSYAAPRIRWQFGTPENFMQMVRAGYQPVYRPREVTFGALEMVGGNLVQLVLLIGPDGVPVVALYMMEREPDGSWKINGCILTAAKDESA